MLVDVAVLLSQKAALIDAARRGLVTQETAEEAVTALDKKLFQTGNHR